MSIAWLRTHGAKFKRNTKIELIVFRVKKDGTLGMAKPCKYCVEMIRKAVYVYGFNIKKVTYSTETGEFESCLVKNLESEFMSSGTKAYKNLMR